MATIRVSYVKAYTDRHGKPRFYFRRRGYATTTLPGLPGSMEFAQAYEAAMAGKKPIGSTIPQSFSHLIAEYYETAAYERLAPITKATYRNVLERFRTEFGDMAVRAMTPGRLDELLEASRNRLTLRKVLRLILKLAVRREWIKVNPTEGVRLPRKAIKGFHDWTEDEIAAYEAKWTTGTRERLALALLLYTLQRRADVVTMGRQHAKPGKIYVAQAKSRGQTRLWLPIHPALKAELDQVPANQLTYLQTQYGIPFTAAGFGQWFSEAAREAGLTNCTAHGLRKSGSRRLAEVGCTEKQLMAVTGHKNSAEVALYTAAADQERLAEEAFAKLETRTKVSNPGV